MFDVQFSTCLKKNFSVLLCFTSFSNLVFTVFVFLKLDLIYWCIIVICPPTRQQSWRNWHVEKIWRSWIWIWINGCHSFIEWKFRLCSKNVKIHWILSFFCWDFNGGSPVGLYYFLFNLLAEICSLMDWQSVHLKSLAIWST